MLPIPPLFTLPIEPSGKITCTQPSPRVYLLTFESPPDNRLTPSFCRSFTLALDILAHRYPKGVVVTTSAISKFYSNGLDYEAAISTKGFFGDVLYPFWYRLITYSMPTIALVNGHAFDGGFMTAMMHDYRVMNPHRGFLCINELEFGAHLPAPMSSIFRQKVPSPNTYRAIVLEARRFNALEALKEGLIDSVGGVDEVLSFCKEFKLVDKAKTGVYGRLKQEMWRETVGFLTSADADEKRMARYVQDQKAREAEEERRVQQWESRDKSGKSKL
ncbi:hypothetical protein MMC07_005983 [Pseudocyphellaria aurata]|nr:hypothetical protein [Pseudocyphellaria aurata]